MRAMRLRTNGLRSAHPASIFRRHVAAELMAVLATLQEALAARPVGVPSYSSPGLLSWVTPSRRS